MKKQTSRGKSKGFFEKSDRFFVIYFAIIALIFLWNLFHCTKVTWLTRDAFYTSGGQAAGNGEEGNQDKDGAGAIELLDSSPITVSVPVDPDASVSGKARLRGAALLGYENANGLLFSGEGIRAEVVQKGSGEVLGEGGMLLKDQTPYPTDETMVYIALSEPVKGTSEEELEVRFSTDGLERNGIFFSGEKITAGSSEDGTGESAGADSLTQESVAARLFYAKKSWNPFNSILYFVLEAVVGVFCWLLWKEKRFPLMNSAKNRQSDFDGPADRGGQISDLDRGVPEIADEREYGDEKRAGNAVRRSANHAGGRRGLRFGLTDGDGLSMQAILPLLGVLALFLFAMLFTWIHTIRRTSGTCSVEILVPKSEEREIIEVPEGESVVQSFVCGQDMLSGAAVRISGRGSAGDDSADAEGEAAEAGGENADSEGTDAADPGNSEGLSIEWQLFDESGTTLLGSGSGKTDKLALVSALLSKESMSEDLKEAAGKYVVLPFDTVIEEAAGKTFQLKISVPKGAAGEADISNSSADSINGADGSGDADSSESSADSINGADGSGDADSAESSADGLNGADGSGDADSADGSDSSDESADSGSSKESASLKLYATSRTNGQAQGSDGLLMEEPMETCLMGLYKNNGFLKSVFLRLLIIMILMLTGLFFAGKMLRDRTAAMYLVCALCMGMVFSFMTPAYTISDERTHIDAVYTISNRLLGITDIPGPEKLYKRACDIDSYMRITMPVTAARYRAVEDGLFGAAPKAEKTTGGAAENTANAEKTTGGAAENTANDEKTTGGTSENTGGSAEASEAGAENPAGSSDSQEKNPAYASGRELTACFSRTTLENVSILCYLPAAVGFSLARILGRNMITMVMAARWLNLLVCALIIYFAVRRMPYGAACMAVIALFPKTLQQITSCSYDGVIIAGTYLFISYSLAAAFDSEYSIADLLTLFLSGFFVASSKGGTYLPVLGLVLLIPFAKKDMYGTGREHRRKRRLWNRITTALLAGSAILFLGKFLALIVSMLTWKPGTVTYGAGETARTLYTFSDFIHAPDKLVNIFINTVNVRGDGIIGELVGKNLSQRWYFVYGFLLLALLGMLRSRGCAKDGIGDRNHVRLAGRAWLLLLAAASTGLIYLSMLIAFTTKGSLYIEGIQGRYFLPIVPLFYLAVENGAIKRDGLEDHHILYTAAVLLAITFSQIMLFYFGGI